MKKVVLLGIAGPTSSGKSTFANNLKKRLDDKAVIISHDSYYKDQSDKTFEERKKTNYDTPEALETDLLVEHLKSLKKGDPVEIPVYDFTLHTRVDKTVKVYPKPIVIVEGIFLFCDSNLKEMFDLKIYIDVEVDVRLARRIKRDVKERGRDLDFVLYQWFTFVRESEKKYVIPSKEFADFIIFEGGENKKAIEVISHYAESLIKR